MKRPGAARAALGAALLAAALGAGFVSARRAGEQIAVLHACEAAQAGDWQAVLDGTEGRTGTGETGRAAIECRCAALLARGRGPECVDLVGVALADPGSGDWAPSPALAVHVIQTWRDAGRTADAAELARRAARLHPERSDLFALELATRAVVEDEEPLLRELAARIPPAGPDAARMRASLATRQLLRGDASAALATLGDAPPPGAGEALGTWYEMRGMAAAMAGDLAGLERTYADWRRAGGDPALLEGHYAVTLSISGLRSPGHPTEELLAAALARGPADPKLAESLAIRLILTLVNDGRTDEAIAVYDREHARFPLEGLSRQELERAAAQRALARTPPEQRRARARFRVAGAPPGSQLLVSPQPDVPVDSDYEARALPASGELTLERRLGPAPLRWALRDAQGRTLASGTATLRPGETREIDVTPRAPREPGSVRLSRRPGDGHRRVVVLLLDCGDWRITQYLRARGELPVLSQLLADGQHAVLWSDPPMTGAALESLVWPTRHGGESVLGIAHRFGVELAGLASVGENPFAALEWILPEQPDLFGTIGAGDRSAANLLLSHGGIQAGRNGVVTGPRGRQRSIPLVGERELSTEERTRFPALAAATREPDATHVRTIAAELDASEELVRGGDVDLVFLRVEPLDILTHAHFAEAVRDGQDDGQGLLFSVYRYLDDRVGRVDALLDRDDVLVVMSDHGIRTAMEHSPYALFIAVGDGVPHGRAPGLPALRGVSRTLTDLLGVASGFPDTGVAAWASGRALARAPATPHPASAVR